MMALICWKMNQARFFPVSLVLARNLPRSFCRRWRQEDGMVEVLLMNNGSLFSSLKLSAGVLFEEVFSEIFSSSSNFSSTFSLGDFL
jgi:hypothetical protein